MNEIYWLTRLDPLNGFFITFSIIFGTIWCVCFVAWICGELDDTTYGNFKDASFWKFSKHLMKYWWVEVLLIFCSIMTPTTKEAMTIWGIGGAIDYLKTNDTAKQIPDKTLQCLEKWMDSYLIEEKK